MRPPGRHTRTSSAAACSWFGREHDPNVDSTASKLPSANVERLARRRRGSRSCRPSAAARASSWVEQAGHVVGRGHLGRCGGRRPATRCRCRRRRRARAPGDDVDGLAQRLADDLQRGADDGVVAGRPVGLLLLLDGFEVDGRGSTVIDASLRRLPAGEGDEPFERGGAGGRFDAPAERVAVAQRVERSAGRTRTTVGDELRRAGRRAGRSRWRGPSRARARRARRSGRTSRPAPRRTARAIVRSSAPGSCIADARSPSAVPKSARATSPESGGAGAAPSAAERGGEHRGAADHVLEHAADGEVRARRRVVELRPA